MNLNFLLFAMQEINRPMRLSSTVFRNNLVTSFIIHFKRMLLWIGQNKGSGSSEPIKRVIELFVHFYKRLNVQEKDSVFKLKGILGLIKSGEDPLVLAQLKNVLNFMHAEMPRSTFEQVKENLNYLETGIKLENFFLKKAFFI